MRVNNLIDEDNGRLSGSSHCKQCSHQLLSFSNPLAHQRRRADVEKGGACLVRNGLTDEGLSWRIIKELMHHIGL